jgi:predicted NBD/HSP70 family sugar kinase
MDLPVYAAPADASRPTPPTSRHSPDTSAVFSPTGTRGPLIESGLTITDVVERAREGDPRARAALEETARHLGGGLAVIVNTLNPAQIFVGGEITEAWDQVGPVIRDVIASRALTSLAAETPIIPEPANTYPPLRGTTALVAAPLFAAPQVA